jgi:hypothetical protein
MQRAEARQWFAASGDIGEMIGPDRWPPQSPDLNIIENLWSHLAEQVSRRRPNTRAELERAIRAEFANVPLAMCQKLVLSAPGRVAQVIAKEGLPLVV